MPVPAGSLRIGRVAIARNSEVQKFIDLKVNAAIVQRKVNDCLREEARLAGLRTYINVHGQPVACETKLGG